MPEGEKAAECVDPCARLPGLPGEPAEEMEVRSSEYELGPGTPLSLVGENLGVFEAKEPLKPRFETLGLSIKSDDWCSGVRL